jgi:hypothetical protein
MVLLLLVLSILGLIGSGACFVGGWYFLKHPGKHSHAVKLPALPSRGESEKPGDFINVVKKAEAGLEAKKE